jgi:hypothetical protein
MYSAATAAFRQANSMLMRVAAEMPLRGRFQMPTRLRRYAPIALAAIAIAFGSIAAADTEEPNTSNKWRIEVSEGADNDGKLVFRVTPEGGPATDVTVSLEKGRGEDGVARDVRAAFKQALDKKKFSIDVDDGEDVLVKKKGGEPDFELALVESTVKGTRINIQKE